MPLLTMDVASGEPGRRLVCGELAAAQLGQEEAMAKDKMLVDTQVYDLAVAFLSEVDGATKADTEALAEAIQWIIEDFIQYEIPERHAAKAGA